MNRLACRTLAVAVGICLGWCAAGFLGPHLPFVGVSLADTMTKPDSHADPDRAPATHSPQPDEARLLVPKPADTPWFRPVLWGVFWLFVAALVLGPIALKVHIPEPPDPAEEH